MVLDQLAIVIYWKYHTFTYRSCPWGHQLGFDRVHHHLVCNKEISKIGKDAGFIQSPLFHDRD